MIIVLDFFCFKWGRWKSWRITLCFVKKKGFLSTCYKMLLCFVWFLRLLWTVVAFFGSLFWKQFTSLLNVIVFSVIMDLHNVLFWSILHFSFWIFELFLLVKSVIFVSFIYGVGVVGFINLVIYLVDQVDLFLWVVHWWFGITNV
jgi:hypothetical protein